MIHTVPVSEVRQGKSSGLEMIRVDQVVGSRCCMRTTAQQRTDPLQQVVERRVRERADEDAEAAAAVSTAVGAPCDRERVRLCATSRRSQRSGDGQLAVRAYGANSGRREHAANRRRRELGFATAWWSLSDEQLLPADAVEEAFL